MNTDDEDWLSTEEFSTMLVDAYNHGCDVRQRLAADPGVDIETRPLYWTMVFASLMADSASFVPTAVEVDADTHAEKCCGLMSSIAGLYIRVRLGIYGDLSDSTKH